MTSLEQVAAPWEGVALICRKCSRKLDGGFGPKGKQKLAKALREGLKVIGRRRALRVIEVDCLGLCPNRAVTVAGEGGRVFVVPVGTDIGTVAETLLHPATI